MADKDEKIKITYDVLVDLFRNEKKQSELQDLDDSFLQDVLDYLKEKQQAYEEALKESELFVDEDIKKLERQLNNIRKIISNLYEKREEKIIKMAINKAKAKNAIIDTSRMLEHEKKLFESLVLTLTSFRDSILENVLRLKEPKLPKDLNFNMTDDQKKKKIKVRFLQPVPSFVDVDGKVYGPYDVNEIDLLPENIAEILLKKKKVEIMK